MPTPARKPAARTPSLPAHLPQRGMRPHARRGVARLRLGRLLAAGLTPAQAARAGSVPEAEVEDLIADPEFALIVAACRETEALPEAERRKVLVSLARNLLFDALALGDLRAVTFVLREERRGRDPAATLADGVIAAGRRAARPAAASLPAPAAAETPPAPPPRIPADPADRAVWRAAAGLRDALGCEEVALRAATAPATGRAPPVGAPRPGDGASAAGPRRPGAVSAPLPAAPRRPCAGGAGGHPAPNRRERRRLAALNRRSRPPAG